VVVLARASVFALLVLHVVFAVWGTWAKRKSSAVEVNTGVDKFWVVPFAGYTELASAVFDEELALLRTLSFRVPLRVVGADFNCTDVLGFLFHG
jgi:hypothetical protein